MTRPKRDRLSSLPAPCPACGQEYTNLSSLKFRNRRRCPKCGCAFGVNRDREVVAIYRQGQGVETVDAEAADSDAAGYAGRRLPVEVYRRALAREWQTAQVAGAHQYDVEGIIETLKIIDGYQK